MEVAAPRFIHFIDDISSFILPDFPATTTWLSNEERALASYRLRESSGSKDEERGSLLSGLRMALSDYKVWLLAYKFPLCTTYLIIADLIPGL